MVHKAYKLSRNAYFFGTLSDKIGAGAVLRTAPSNKLRRTSVDTKDLMIASVEFGDWLLNEFEVETHRAESKNEHVHEAAVQRLASLGHAKELLFEFLSLQQEMMEFARLDHSAEEQAMQSSKIARSA
jgi:hypothetical protein